MLAFSFVYFSVCIGYFTYAADAAAAAGIGAATTSVIFSLVGATAIMGALTGRWTMRFGSRAVAGGSLVVAGVATMMLGTLTQSTVATLASAAVFGAGYMVGSAVLAIWAVELEPDRPTEALTAALVVGSISSMATPVSIGVLRESIDLSTLLTIIGAIGVMIGADACVRWSCGRLRTRGEEAGLTGR